MAAALAFFAVLLHEDAPDRDYGVSLLSTADGPPFRLRVRTTFEGAAAWDVYQLTDAEQWPACAVYVHVSIDPGTSSTRFGHEQDY